MRYIAISAALLASAILLYAMRPDTFGFVATLADSILFGMIIGSEIIHRFKKK